jgi:hypothetical protein
MPGEVPAEVGPAGEVSFEGEMILIAASAIAATALPRLIHPNHTATLFANFDPLTDYGIVYTYLKTE